MNPNLIIIGAPKSGTTSLYYYLNNHPEICLSYRKEILFFDSSYHKGINWYTAHFRNHKGESIIGDISPTYLHHPQVPKRIYRHFPQAKLVCILRNPIERAYSHYWDLVGWDRDHRSFRQTLDFPRLYKRGASYLEFDILEMGYYYKHIMHYLSFFDKNQLGIFFFDDLKTDTRNCVNKMLQFLNLDTFDKNEGAFQKKHHTSRVNRSKWLGNLLVSEAARELVHKIVPGRIVPPIRKAYQAILNFNSKRISPDPMKLEDKQFLLKTYREDIMRLGEFTKKNLDSWLK